MSWDDLTGTGVVYAASAVDSARFGFEVGRLTVRGGDPSAAGVEADVVAAMQQARAEVVVARWPASLTQCAALACDLAPRVIAADSLVYWEADVDDVLTRTADRADHEFRHGDVEPEELADVFADSFEGYRSHYSANPVFPRDLVLAGYLEWAAGSVAADPGSVVTLRRDGRPIGFATTSSGGGPESSHLEIELAGLRTSEQGGGRYGVLLRGVAALARDRGVGRLVISTQAGNTRVQRAWVRAGFEPLAAFTTVHLMEERA